MDNLNGVDNTPGVVPGAWASWLNVILGIWLIIAPFVLNYAYNSTSLWNSVILGIAILIVAYAATQSTSPGPSWWNLIFGVWLIISPWVLGFVAGTANTIIVGAIVGVLALAAALSKYQYRPGHPASGPPVV